MGWSGLHLPDRLRAEWSTLRRHPGRLVFDIMLLLVVLYVAVLFGDTYNGRF